MDAGRRLRMPRVSAANDARALRGASDTTTLRAVVCGGAARQTVWRASGDRKAEAKMAAATGSAEKKEKLSYNEGSVKRDTNRILVTGGCG
jgi:hypothetical protein